MHSLKSEVSSQSELKFSQNLKECISDARLVKIWKGLSLVMILKIKNNILVSVSFVNQKVLIT